MGFSAKQKEKEQSIYNVKELTEDGYLYDDTGIYIPYNPDPRDIYLKISRNPDKKCELIYAWVMKKESIFKVLTIFKRDKLINESDKKFNESLSIAGKGAGLDSPEDCYVNFTNEFKSKIILVDGLEVFKELFFEFPEEEEEIEEETEIEEEVFGFDSYPKLIQKEALKIINDGSLYEKYVDSISITHAGNQTTKDQLALITVSLFIGEPTHTELDANTGHGKTDVTTETVKNIPDNYVHHLSTVSPKNIYYDRDSYGKYNIVIFDDVVLTDENIGLLKVLSDNNKPVKELKTVIDKKAVNFTLPGKFLVIITYAKDNPDEELLNRLYKLNMNIDEDSKKVIKNKIKYNTIINSDDNEIISRSRLIIQAAIQYLVEQELEIFNPFAVLFDPTPLENRNIKHFIAMVKSKSFFHTNKLKKIDFAGKTIYIGSYEDFWHVAEIWSKEADTQKYKLNDKEKNILSILKEKTRDDAINDNIEDLKNYKEAVAARQAEILDKLDTRKTISKRIGVSETTVRNYLDRSQGTSKSLLDLGLIGRIRFNAENDNSPWVYYKVKKDDNDDEETLWQDWRIENANHFDTFKSKIRILLSFLYLANITVNEKGYTYLKKYCEDETHCIDLNDYDSYYDFINGAISNFKLSKYAVKLEDAKLSDLKYMIDQFSSQAKKIEEDHQGQNSASSANQPKRVKNALNDDTTSNSYGDSDLPSAAREWDSTSIFGSEINRPDFALEICELLFNQNLNFGDIFDAVYQDQDFSIPDAKEYCNMELSEQLDLLESYDYINSSKNEDGETYYQLDDDLKEVLANFTTHKEPTDKIFENDLIQADYGFKLFEL
ncbi:MAG: hypothetical protein UIB63_01455 [Methanobrevibacter sp.]|uniref:hypothetical protein n=1 Tax=Methanobrevibacter sp. TaxID=66852 RepID=UPI002E78D50D|nr:hypothetical protein [Methanobrevibacter sp.]MEE0941759.1 hypothetical protein [Methanobrevibacter sp.]